jgi:hypothetical protein
MPKSLFDSDKYTEESRVLDQKASDLLEPLFKEYIEKGYSIREISHVIHSAVNYVEIMLVSTKKRTNEQHIQDCQRNYYKH